MLTLRRLFKSRILQSPTPMLRRPDIKCSYTSRFDDTITTYTIGHLLRDLKALNHPDIHVSQAPDGKIEIDIKHRPSSEDLKRDERVQNLTAILDGYFQNGGHHLNVNCLNREMLKDAVEYPERYPGLTIRVSGYAVAFSRLTREQQMEVINRTFHDSI